MIKTSERVEMTLQPNLTVGGYLGMPDYYPMEDRQAAAVIFRLDIPYLYFDEKGSKETLDQKEWEDAQSLSNPKVPNNFQRLAYFPDSDAVNRYDFSRDGVNWLSVDELTHPETGDITNGLSGTWYLRYKSTSSTNAYQLRPGAQTLSGRVQFVGSVPDNTGATALLGYSYQYYVNANGEEISAQQPTEVEPGRRRADGAQNVLRATFIQTNLKWDLTNRSMNTPVLWDHYNYAVYKVQVKNNSDTRDSEIDFINYVLMFDAATGSTSGIRLEDLLTWKKKKGSDDFEKNTSISASEEGATYIGKPKEGGALVYDVSTLTDDEIAQIDMVDFSNVADFGLEELPYATGGHVGQITVDIHEDNMPYGKHLFSHTDKANESVGDDFVPPEDESDVHTLLVAMPYTTNYGTGEGGYAEAKLETYATVNFGNRGYDEDGNSNDYQWMKNVATRSRFAAPEFKVSLNKRSQNILNGTLSSQQNAPLGEMITYVIDGMKNDGNTPLYGDDPNVSWGPVLADGLPSGFQLTGLTLRVDASDQSRTEGEGDDEHPVADIADWYDVSQGNAVLEFEVKNSSGATSWRAAPAAFAEIERGPNDAYAVYRLGSVERAADGIAEMLEKAGVAAVPGRRYTSPPAYTFTGHFRLKFKNHLPAKTAITSSLSVTGLMMERASNGANGWYDNQADITYGKRLWVVNPDHYTQNRETTVAAKSTFVPVDPAPQNTAKVFSMYDGSGSSDVNMTTEADRRNALVNTANAGYRFRFGDNSTSRMAPAVIAIGPIPDRDITDPAASKDPQFVANRLKLSSAFFGDDPLAKVEKITLGYYASTATTDILRRTMEVPLSSFTAERDADGNLTGSYYVDMAALGIGYLLDVRIDVDAFKSSSPLSTANAMVEIMGTPVDVGDITVASSFSTDYESSPNLVAKDNATLHSMYVPITPVVSASYGYVDNNGTTRHNQTVPYRWGDMDDEVTYFRYDLTNSSPYAINDFDMDLMVNGLAQQDDGTSTVWRGFLTRSVVIPGYAYGDVAVLDQYGNPVLNPDGSAKTETRWYYRYGTVGSIDVFDQFNATGTIMKAEDEVDPNKSYDIEAAVKAMGAAGGTANLGDGSTLTIDAATGNLILKVATDGMVNGKHSSGASEAAPVKMVRVRFSKVNDRVTSGACPVIYLYGRADTHSNVTTDVQAFSTTPVYGPDMMLPTGKRMENGVNRLVSKATMTVGTFAGSVTWTATKSAGARPNLGTEQTAGAPGGVEVANYSDNNSYDFTIRSTGLSRSDDATVSVNVDDLSPRLQNPINDVQGFKTRTVTLDAGLFNFGSTVRKDNTPSKLGTSLVKATFYFRDDALGVATPLGKTVVLSAADLKTAAAGAGADGKFAIDVTSGSFAGCANLYLERIEFTYTEIDPYLDTEDTIKVRLTGKVNHWYNNVVTESSTGYSSVQYSRVRATGRINQTAPLDAPKYTVASQAQFRVYYPALSVHTFGQYGPDASQYMNTRTDGDNSCSDGSRTTVGVPYDRDFKLWTNIYNERGISSLDDLDVTMQLPLSYEGALQLDGSTVYDYVGFHTTRVTVNSELFDTFKKGTVGTIEFIGYDEGAGADAKGSVSWTIRPDDVYAALDRGTFPGPEALPDSFVDDNGFSLDRTADGDLVITEKMLRDHGIKNLKTVILHAWQDMDIEHSSDRNQQNVVFEGFADHNFDTAVTMTAEAKNYLLKLRGDELKAALAAGMVNNPVVRTDRSNIYMSKLYFDTINRAGLYDSNSGGNTNAPTTANRFSQYVYGSGDTHHIGHSGYSAGEYNFALDVGYKSQVSLISDFRQVNSAYNEVAPENNCGTEQGPHGRNSDGWQGRNLTYVGPETYNSGMVLHMTQKIPNEYFDSYYIKVRRQAAEYLDQLRVTYSDGKQLVVEGSQIKELLEGTDADSVQNDYDGEKYFKLNLLARDASGNPVASFGAGESAADSYRHPVSDYESASVVPGDPRFTVTKIEYDVRINQQQFDSGDNRYISGMGDWTESDTAGATLGRPDYGTWFRNINTSTADIVNQMSFEVNGRMYAETATAGVNMYVDTSMEVGGTNSGNDRPGHVSVVRSDTPERHSSESFRGAWSYQDYHRSGGYYSHNDCPSYMRHLRSRTKVVARTDGTYTMEGINYNGTDHMVLGDTSSGNNYTDHALFGGDVNFATSVYRHTIYRENGIYSGDQEYETNSSAEYGPNDWGWNYTSFADNVHVADTMPWCQPDDDLSYYGFLSTGMHVQNGVLNHLRDYDRATITFTTKQWVPTKAGDGSDATYGDGFRVFGEDATAARSFQLRKDGLYEQQADKTWAKISDKGLAFLTGEGSGYIQFTRPDEETHSEIVDFKKANADGVVEIPLRANEFIATYDMDLGPYYGNGDITSEGKYLEVDRDGDASVLDIRLFGRPYIYKGQQHPGLTHGGCGDKADALNHVSSRYYNFKDMSLPVNNYTAAQPSGIHPGANDWKNSWNASVTHRNKDTAYFLGYLIPFGYKSDLAVNKEGNQYHSTNRPDLPDYEADNLTPENVRYEVRFKNINDVNEGVDDENRAAHISSVRLNTSWGAAFTQPVTGSADAIRLQRVYLPAQFVPVGGHTRDDNWFRAQDFKFTVHNVASGTNATVSLSWTDLVNLGLLSGSVSGTGTAATFTGDATGSAEYPGCYIIDVEKYLRMTEVKRANAGLSDEDMFALLAGQFDVNIAGRTLADGQTEADARAAVVNLVKAGIVGHYQATDRTNTLGGAWVGDADVDLTYAAPYVTSVEFVFTSPNSNREKPETMLDSGEWLGANKTRDNTDYAHNFAYAYDGVYADREVEDFRTAKATGTDPAKGNWNYWSTPSFDKQGNGFGGMRMTAHLTVSDVVTRDPNKKAIVKTEDNSRSYDLSHRLGALVTDMQRGKKVVMNGTEQRIFAYDADQYSVTSPWSYAPDATDGAGSGIPNGDLYAGDYVEYLLYLGSGVTDDAGNVSKVRTDLTFASLDDGTPFELDPLPLEHVDARFEVPVGQRIVGWEVEKYYDSAKNVWVENNTASAGAGAVLPITATLADADGNNAAVVQPQTDLSRATIAEDGTRTSGEGAEQSDLHRNLHLSVGNAYAADKGQANATSQIDPGRGVWVRVITQMTDELEEDEDYQSKENQANRSDNPSYQGQSLQANFYAVAAPLHGYTQYRTYNNSGTSSSNNRATADFASDSSEVGYITGPHTTGAGVADNCQATSATLLRYSFIADKDVRFDGKEQLSAHDYANVVFHNHVKEKPGVDPDPNRVAVEPEFWDPNTQTMNPASSSGQLANADGNRMRLRINNIRNSTWHESTMSVTVSFMRGVSGTGTEQGSYGDGTDGFDAFGNPAGKRYFELTHQPTYVADETVEVLGYPSDDITKNAAWNSTTPAKVLGLTNASPDADRAQALMPDSVNLDATAGADGQLRPGVKIEYYVPDWHRADTPSTASFDSRASIVPESALARALGATTGEWVSYDELKARYTVGDVTQGGTVTPEGHTANGNVFRDVTGVRITYYDVPATADGTTAFPLDDVSLLGVARYQDTRLDDTAVNR